MCEVAHSAALVFIRSDGFHGVISKPGPGFSMRMKYPNGGIKPGTEECNCHLDQGRHTVQTPEYGIPPQHL